MHSKFNRMQEGFMFLTKVQEALNFRVASSRPVCDRKKDDNCGPWLLNLENEHNFSFPEERQKLLYLS